MQRKHIGAIAFAALALSGCETMNQTEPQPGQQQAAAPARIQTLNDSETLRRLQDDFNKAAGDRVFFALSQDDIDPRGLDILQKQLSWLQGKPDLEIVIEGHADETGSALLNMELGQKRAQRVAKYLTQNGFSPDRLRIISYGETRPYAQIDPTTEIAAMALNRRAVTVLSNFQGPILSSPSATPPVPGLQNNRELDNAAYPQASAPAYQQPSPYDQERSHQSGASTSGQGGTDENPVVLAPEGIQPPKW